MSDTVANIEGETRAEAFSRLANARLPKTVKRLRQLGNLASGNYDYTPEQASTLIGVLRSEIDKLEAKFNKASVEDDLPLL